MERWGGEGGRCQARAPAARRHEEVDADAEDRQSPLASAARSLTSPTSPPYSATTSPNIKLLHRFSFNSISEQSAENLEFETVMSPTVMCEGALWTNWVHHGTMLSTSPAL